MYDNLLIFLIINLIISLIYSIAFKIIYKKDFLARFIILTLIPLFGLALFLILDFFKVKDSYLNFTKLTTSRTILPSNIEESIDVSSIEKEAVPIYDLLTLSDKSKIKESILCDFNSDFKKSYPLIKSMLLNEESDIVSFASAKIASIRERIIEEYSATKSTFLNSCKDSVSGKEYLEALINVIYLSEFEEEDVTEKRNDLLTLFNYLQKENAFLEEKFYIEKISNDIKLGNYNDGFNTCKDMLKSFPDNAEVYLCALNFFFKTKKRSHFVKLLNYLKTIDIYFSNQDTSLIVFWQNKLTAK